MGDSDVHVRHPKAKISKRVRLLLNSSNYAEVPSTSILTTRLKLRSKLTAKTVLGPIYPRVDTTVRKPKIRTCTVHPKAANGGKMRRTMVTFARQPASPAS